MTPGQTKGNKRREASPDLPTPALPKTASFTSGLLAMTAAELSGSFSGVKGQPSMLSAATQQETASEETR